MTATPNTHNTLDLKSKIAVADYLKSVLVARDDGFVIYTNGLTDVSAAKALTLALGRAVSPHNVASIRKDLFGMIYRDQPPPGPSDHADLLARIERLEAWARSCGGEF